MYTACRYVGNVGVIAVRRTDETITRSFIGRLS